MLIVLGLSLVGRGARVVERGIAQRAEVPLLPEPVDPLLLRHCVPALVAEHPVLVDGEVHGEVAELGQRIGEGPLELGLAAVPVLVLVPRRQSGQRNRGASLELPPASVTASRGVAACTPAAARNIGTRVASSPVAVSMTVGMSVLAVRISPV